jgi:hypothetical protein
VFVFVCVCVGGGISSYKTVESPTISIKPFYGKKIGIFFEFFLNSLEIFRFFKDFFVKKIGTFFDFIF